MTSPNNSQNETEHRYTCTECGGVRYQVVDRGNRVCHICMKKYRPLRSDSQNAHKWRNKHTGTVYASVEFNSTAIAVVTTDAGASFNVHKANLERVPGILDSQNDTELREQIQARMLSWYAEVTGQTNVNFIPDMQITNLIDDLAALIAQREQAAELRGRINELLGVISYSGYDVKTNIISIQTRTVGERYVQLNDELQATKPEKEG